MNVLQFEVPTTVDEAVELLGRPGAAPVGGGTTLGLPGPVGDGLLVDVTRCGLDAIAVDGDVLRIGAAVRAADLHEGTLPQGAESVLLTEAAQGIATQPIRNAVTVGGNIVYLCRWADLPVALLALDGTVHARHKDAGAYDVSIGELIEKHPKRALTPGSLVTGVSVPLRGGRRGASYLRFRTTATENALIAVAVVLEASADGTGCASACISVGAIAPRPVRTPLAEALLTGGELTAERIAEAAEKVREEATIAPNFRMEKDIQARILLPIVRRAIAQAADRAGVGGAR